MLFVVTSKRCGICAKVKSLIKTKGLDYTEYDATSPEGIRIIQNCKLQAFPIVLDNNGKYYCGKDALQYAKGL